MENRYLQCPTPRRNRKLLNASPIHHVHRKSKHLLSIGFFCKKNEDCSRSYAALSTSVIYQLFPSLSNYMLPSPCRFHMQAPRKIIILSQVRFNRGAFERSRTGMLRITCGSPLAPTAHTLICIGALAYVRENYIHVWQQV